MPRVAGVTLLDLLGGPAGLKAAVSPGVLDLLRSLATAEVEASVAPDAFRFTGTVQSLRDLQAPVSQTLRILIPGGDERLRFRLTLPRAPPAPADTVEPAQAVVLLELEVSFRAPLAGLVAAVRVDPGGARPPVLRPATGAGAGAGPVQISGRGWLRVVMPDAGPTTVELLGAPDPLALNDPPGAAIPVRLEPPHVLFGRSGFGLTVEDALLDLSERHGSRDAEEAGLPAAWKGLQLREASLYLPEGMPFIGTAAFQVRDLFLGFDGQAVRGALALEAGQGWDDPAVVRFEQRVNGRPQALAVTRRGAGRSSAVVLQSDGPVRAWVGSGDTAEWTLPGASPVLAVETGPLPAQAAAVVGYRPSAAITEGGVTTQTFGPPHRFELGLPAGDGLASAIAAPVRLVDASGGSHAHVASVVVSPDDTARLTFHATGDDPGAARWQLGASRAVGASFRPPTLPAGEHALLLTDPLGRRFRVRLQVEPGAPGVAGAAAGVATPPGYQAPEPAGLFDASAWHRDGALSPAPEASSGGQVPEGRLQLLRLHPLVPAREQALHLRLFMELDARDVTGGRALYADGEDPFGPAEDVVLHSSPAPSDLTLPEDAAEVRPNVGEGNDTAAAQLAALGAWVVSLPPGAILYVVGRACDLGREDYNRRLGAARAAFVAEALAPFAAAAGATVYSAGEDEQRWSDGSLRSAGPPELAANHPQRAALMPHLAQGLVALGISSAERASWVNNGPERRELRRVDVYAALKVVPPTVAERAPFSRPVAQPPSPLSLLRPGPLPAIREVPSEPPVLPWAASVRVRWDTPAAVRASDYLPVEARIRTERQLREVDAGNPINAVNIDDPSEPRAAGVVVGLEAAFHFHHGTGLADLVLSIDSGRSGRGLAVSRHTLLSTAAALAPALLAGLEQQSQVLGGGARIAALAAAVAAIDELLVSQGVTRLERLELRLFDIGGAGPKTIQLAADYQVELQVQSPGPSGLGTTKPLVVRYRNVRIEVATGDAPVHQRYALAYDDADFEIVDPGSWRLDGALGTLLTLTAVRIGAGSFFIEADLAFSLDLGVITVRQACLRIVLAAGQAPRVELRGLQVELDVPGLIRGRGQLEVRGSRFSARIAVRVHPVQLDAVADLRLSGSMTELDLRVLYPAGLPLAGTGLAVYGFIGRFTSNGTRRLDGTVDPIQRELRWYAASNKYRPQARQWAMGLGTVVGTMLDRGYTLHASGSLAFEAPSPAMILGVGARFLAEPSLDPAERQTGAGQQVFTGIIALDDGVTVALEGRFDFHSLFSARIPVGVRFGRDGRFFIHLGADGYGGRPRRPLSVRLLPRLLDLEVRAYTMIQSHGLRDLGGRGIDLGGFCIGFGAVWKKVLRAGPFSLSYSASVHGGLGIRPFLLALEVDVRGRVDLLVIALGASGTFQLMLGEQRWYFSGSICVRVSFFFFSVGACFRVAFGNRPSDPTPLPSSFVQGLTLVSPDGHVVGRSGSDTEAPVVWPDAVLVLHFAHGAEFRLGPSSSVAVNGPPMASPWVGSERIRHAFRVVRIAIVDTTLRATVRDVAGLPTAWQLEERLISGATEHGGGDVWSLAINAWDAQATTRALEGSSAGLGPRMAQAAAALCASPPAPQIVCAMAKDAAADLGAGGWRLTLPAQRYDNVLQGAVPLHLHAEVPNGEALVRQLRGVDPLVRISLAERLTVPSAPAWIADGASTQALRCPAVEMELFTLGLGTAELSFEEPVQNPTLDLYLEARLQGWVRVVRRVSLRNLAVAPGAVVETEGVRVSSSGWLQPRPAGLYDAAKGQFLVAPLPEPPGLVVGVELRATRLDPLSPTQQAAGLARAAIPGGVRVWLGEDPSASSPSMYAAAPPAVAQLSLAHGGDTHLMEVAWVLLMPAAHFVDQLVTNPPLPSVSWRGVGAPVTATLSRSTTVRPSPNRAGFYLRYTSPVAELPFTAAELGPAPGTAGGGTLHLIRCCALPTRLARAHAEAVARSAAFSADMERATNGVGAASSGDGGDAGRGAYLFHPARRYEVEVDWEVVQWRRQDGPNQPPAQIDWSGAKLTTERFAFRTAPASGSGELVDLVGVEVFEPRRLARYLAAWGPDRGSPPHFTSDPLRVVMRHAHVDRLLARYGRSAQLSLRRTDPPPAAIDPEARHAQVFAFAHDPGTAPPDPRLDGALSGVPCFRAPTWPSTTVTLEPALEPRARYDFKLSSQTSAGAPVDILHAHFATSAHASGDALLEALGFARGAEAHAIMPLDLALPAALPRQAILGDDGALEATLRALGLDPLPLPEAPRTFALWRRTAARFELEGVLFDADEPIERPPLAGETAPRLELRAVRLLRPSGSVIAELTPVRSTINKTRLLWAVRDGAVAPGEAGHLTLEVRQRGSSLTWWRWLLERPRMMREEVER